MKRKDIDTKLLNQLTQMSLKLQNFTEIYNLSDENIHSLNIVALDILTIIKKIKNN